MLYKPPCCQCSDKGRHTAVCYAVAMLKSKTNSWFLRLLSNSRFWILISGIVLSVCIAGIVQLLIPSGSLQIIRMEQTYGLIAVLLLYAALLASPLTKNYPNFSFKEAYLHARRAIGVLAFYFAFLHSFLAFFLQLGGFNGIKYYSSVYNWSLLLGVLALGILFVMAATSVDWVIRVMSFKRWKLLHRLVYVAGVSILVHIVLVGSHFEQFNFLSTLTVVALILLLWLQLQRIAQNVKDKKKVPKK